MISHAKYVISSSIAKLWNFRNSELCTRADDCIIYIALDASIITKRLDNDERDEDISLSTNPVLNSQWFVYMII